MTNNQPIDHAAEAEKCLRAAAQAPSYNDGTNPEARLLLAEAQVHAALAHAEQQRIANVIALNQTVMLPTNNGVDAWLVRVDVMHEPSWPDIAAALRIGDNNA